MTAGDSLDPTRAHLPLTHLAYLILLVLSEGAAHGYAVIREVEERSGGVVSPGTGSFYEILRRMRRDGLVADAAPPTRATGGGRRRYYELTSTGAAVLRAETLRLRALVREAERRGVLSGPREETA